MSPPNLLHFLAGAAAAALLLAAPVGGVVAGTKHDLTTTFEPYSDQVCAFCHTPHAANTDVAAPLWNRFVDQGQAYTLYQSPTMDTSPQPPNFSVSEVCLGCHDGTLGSAVVAGISGSTKHDLVNAPGPGGIPDTTSYPNCRNCHGEFYGDPATVWQGTDLSDDHPIGMTYPGAAVDPEFNAPPDAAEGWSDIPLYGGTIQCPTCHQVHDNTFAPFLRVSNAASSLCITCHQK